jgi:hypothetical protein
MRKDQDRNFIYRRPGKTVKEKAGQEQGVFVLTCKNNFVGQLHFVLDRLLQMIYEGD